MCLFPIQHEADLKEMFEMKVKVGIYVYFHILNCVNIEMKRSIKYNPDYILITKNRAVARMLIGGVHMLNKKAYT